MENLKITNHSELQFRIMQLKSEKVSQEIEFKSKLKEFAYTISPISIVKSSIRDLVSDREVRFDIAKVGLNVGADFLIDKIVGRGRSIKGFLTSILVEKVSSTLINNNTSSIVSVISKLFHANTKKSE
jgi:hypothetical protein